MTSCPGDATIAAISRERDAWLRPMDMISSHGGQPKTGTKCFQVEDLAFPCLLKWLVVAYRASRSKQAQQMFQMRLRQTCQ
ncbi:hypothetical protein MRX96_057915 [Rhipicephalus microplus]